MGLYLIRQIEQNMKYLKIFAAILLVFLFLKYEDYSYYRNQESFRDKSFRSKISRVEFDRDNRYYYNYSDYFNESMIVGTPIEANDSIIKFSDTIYIKKYNSNYTEKIKAVIKYRKFSFFSI